VAISIVEEAFKKCFEGMSEEDGHNILEDLMLSHGVEKKWHPSKFRIGQNTVKSFRDKSEEGIILRPNDLIFIDIGPVVNEHEGDYGKTFVYMPTNDSKGKIIHDLDVLFGLVKKKWEDERPTGIELYKYACTKAQELGYILNERMKGHRIGDFPHHLHYRGGLNEYENCPSSELWILELHILDAQERYGAFFEDILVRDQ